MVSKRPVASQEFAWGPLTVSFRWTDGERLYEDPALCAMLMNGGAVQSTNNGWVMLDEEDSAYVRGFREAQEAGLERLCVTAKAWEDRGDALRNMRAAVAQVMQIIRNAADDAGDVVSAALAEAADP